MKKVHLLFILLLLTTIAFGQLSVTVPTITASPGQTVNIPVKIYGASSTGIPVSSINLHITYDTAKLTYVTTANFYSGTPGTWYCSGNYNGDGGCNSFTASANWLEGSLLTVTIPDGTTLYEIQFISKGGNNPLNFCIYEFTDEGYELINTTPTNGAVNMATVTWTGSVSSDWSAAGNWSTNVVPGAGYNATIPAGIPNMPVINAAPGAPASCVDLTINSGASVTVAAGKALTVKGDIVNSSTTGIIINSDATATGSLIFNNQGVYGTAQRYVAAWGDLFHGWHLLSSPVAAQPFQPGFVSSPPSSAEDFYQWSETSGLWINSKVGTTAPFSFNSVFGTNFEVGKGYLVAYQNAGPKVFSGVMNVSDVVRTGLTHTPGPAYTTNGDPGWNLIGNPFSSAISWFTNWTHSTNIGAVAKIWNESTASYIDISPGGIIPAMQGFMVESTSGTGSLTIPKAARTHSGQSWYKNSSDPCIRLVVKNPAAQTAQESVLAFNNQTTPGYDPAFDSHFFPGYAPQFYSLEGSERLSTNVMPEIGSQTIIPLQFIKTEGEEYSIEAVKIENVNAQVYLTDMKTGHIQNLTEMPVYSFTSSEGDDPARFLLSFGHVGISEKESERVIYTYGNTLYIVNPGKARLEIYNLSGQVVFNEEISTPELYHTSLSLDASYYIVRLTTGTKVTVSKVYIKY